MFCYNWLLNLSGQKVLFDKNAWPKRPRPKGPRPKHPGQNIRWPNRPTAVKKHRIINIQNCCYACLKRPEMVRVKRYTRIPLVTCFVIQFMYNYPLVAGTDYVEPNQLTNPGSRASTLLSRDFSLIQRCTWCILGASFSHIQKT